VRLGRGFLGGYIPVTLKFWPGGTSPPPRPRMNGTPNGNNLANRRSENHQKIYAPQTGCTENAEDELWESLQGTIPPHEIMFIVAVI